MPSSGKNSFYVATNNYQAQFDLLKANYDLEKFSKLFYIGGDENCFASVERFRAVMVFCRAYGVTLDYIMGDFSRDFGHKSISEFNLEDHVIACGCDLIAVGVVDYLVINNKSNPVLGFDGIGIVKYLYKNFMTVQQDVELISQTVIEKIVAKNTESKQVGYKIITSEKEYLY